MHQQRQRETLRQCGEQTTDRVGAADAGHHQHRTARGGACTGAARGRGFFGLQRDQRQAFGGELRDVLRRARRSGKQGRIVVDQRPGTGRQRRGCGGGRSRCRIDVRRSRLHRRFAGSGFGACELQVLETGRDVRRRLPGIHAVFRRGLGKAGSFVDVQADRRVVVQLRRCRRQARLRLQTGLGLAAGRQHVLMALQLGRQVPRPALRFPTLAARGQLGLVEDHGDARQRQRRIQPLQCVLDRRFERDQHRAGGGIGQGLRVDRARVVFQHDRRADQVQRFAQALARLAGTGQQCDRRGGGVAVIREHGRSPAGRRRCASDPTLGKACRDSAARPVRRRAGGAFRRCAR
ncbi:hypothetical protein NB689_003345 [Xanthomonas sacchari]|nr:hypothetical protein [Xanthomonas sacchari]